MEKGARRGTPLAAGDWRRADGQMPHSAPATQGLFSDADVAFGVIVAPKAASMQKCDGGEPQHRGVSNSMTSTFNRITEIKISYCSSLSLYQTWERWSQPHFPPGCNSLRDQLRLPSIASP